MKTRNLLLSLFAFTVCSGAHAQFEGDLFFEEPSIVVAAGATGKLQLAMFAGAKPFGAARAKLKLDPGTLEVTGVEAPANAGFVLEWKRSSDGIDFMVINPSATAAPIGTVTLASISVRAVASAGTQVSVRSEIGQAFAADRTAYRSGTGLNAQVNIGAVAAAVVPPGAAAIQGSSRPVVDTRAASFRRPGFLTSIHEQVAPGLFVRRAVQSPPTSSPVGD